LRNPFIEYVEPALANNTNNSNSNSGNTNTNTAQPAEPVITFADIKSGVPFRLDGIITSGSNRIAVVDTGKGVEFVHSSFEKNSYYISAINQDSIIVNNRGFTFQLMIGGEINER
jgi:type II secretory pathway component PulC